MPVLLVLGVLLLLGGTAVSLYTDLLWFRSVDYSTVFTTVLTTKLLMFVLFGLLMAVLIGANVAIAYRVRPPFRPMSLEQQNLERYRVAVEPFLRTLLLLGSAVFGLFAGLSAAARWETWLLWRNGTAFGQVDAQFGRDISYYAFTYPFLRFVLGFLLTAIILATIVAAATHYLFGGVRLQSGGEKVSPAARAHLSVLLGIVVLIKAYAYYLDRFGLVFSERGVVQGASFTDVNAVLPAKNILVGIAVVCALLFFANIVVRNIFIPVMALGLLVLSAVVIGGIYPAYTQQFRVKPNEVQREAEFIGRNIDATRKAYGIADAVVTDYEGEQTATPGELRADQGTIPNARLLDPNVLPATFEQLQRIRTYFGVPDALDVDRYTVDGVTQDYIVAAREVDQTNLTGQQRNWINEHLIYTHGNGFIAAPANEVDADGQPVFAVGGVPVQGPNGGPSPIRIDQPRVYFGELSPEYSVVNTQQGEIDGPESGGEQQTFNYDGDGGVRLGGLANKLAFAAKFREPNLLLSGAIQPDSRIMYIREPRERVQKVAPFLELDSDPYPAVVDGKMLWIVDGYTTSAGYPYAQRTVLGNATADSQTARRLPQEEVNYIRNSVKATVDAYTGDVTLYQFGERDPVLETWSKAFDGVLRPESEISDELRAHLRYPEDLFKLQRELLAQYHELDPQAFYNKEDFWAVPRDPADAVNRAANAGDGAAAAPAAGNLVEQVAAAPPQPPYYALLQFPGQPASRFSLSTSFVALGRPNLTAYASVSSDPEDYGTIRILELEANDVPGPGQVANQFLTNPQVAESLLALRRNGTNLTFGNLLTLPVGGGLLYVQPVFVRAQGGESFPTLQRVIVSFGTDTASEPTLPEALDSLFGAGAGGGVAPGPGAAPSPSPSASPGAAPAPSTPPVVAGDVPALIAEADAAFRAGQDALRANDFAAYGQAQERLRRALEQLANSARPPATPPAPAPLPTPAG
ncbi:MAG: hypothetical protein JWN88_3064 [Frankiales bacterium]|jgi:hypothetical protein|nr:hypothetical protein [Frankiales bacterium]